MPLNKVWKQNVSEYTLNMRAQVTCGKLHANQWPLQIRKQYRSSEVLFLKTEIFAISLCEFWTFIA